MKKSKKKSDKRRKPEYEYFSRVNPYPKYDW